MRDLSNMKFGRISVIKYYGKTSRRKDLWICSCSCGAEKIIKGDQLVSGSTRSCGCLRTEIHTLHGHNRKNNGPSTTHNAWCSMIQRCLNKNNTAYKDYGGRGIKVCDKWRFFSNFLSDMGERPHGLYLERLNNDLGYFPENCIWATPTQQARNRRSTRLNEDIALEIRRSYSNGEMSRIDLAKKFGVCVNTVVAVLTNKTWRV